MAYTQYTQASFTAELAQVLNDPNHVYWAQDELNRALNEALLLWGALTSYWTVRGTFGTSTNPFYDLSVQLPSYRSRSYTFDQLTREIQYHFYEPANGVTGAGMTDQFSINAITAALVRMRNQFVIDTRIPLTFVGPLAAPVSPNNQMQLAQSTALIARAAWIDNATGIVTPLRRTDTFAGQSYNPTWNQGSGTPYGYSQVEAMPGTVNLIPPASAAGSIHLLLANTLQFTVTTTTTFQIPDEFAWALKYAAMDEVMSTNAQGFDPIRSRYCRERYDAARDLAQTHRSVIQVRSNNNLLPLTTVASLDSSKPYWQTGTGAPQIAACAYDLLAFYHVPGSGYTIACDVSQTAPLPVNPTDTIQLGPEELSYVFDYCRHILQIKLGGVEFIQSMPLYDNFQKGAQQRSKLITYKARYLTPLFTRAQEEEQVAPAA